MNFEERLKAGLDDAPGGQLTEEQIREVIRRSEYAARTRNLTQRTQQLVRVTATVGAAVLLAGAVLGGTLWAKRPYIEPGGEKIGTSAIQLYDTGTLKPSQPISFPSLNSHLNENGTTLPAVKVKTTYAFSVGPSFTTPSSVAAPVPSSLAEQLEAYFVQMNANTAFYLIGPRGMTGKAELAADGSFAVYLHNRDATIELDTAGGSFMASSSMAAPFFATARSALTSSGFKGSSPIQRATVTRPNKNTTLFAFATGDGRRVVGYDFYQPQQGVVMGPFGQSALMVYSATSKDWSLAEWVMNAGMATLNNIGQPQIGASQLLGEKPTVRIDNHTYVIPGSNGAAVSTPEGIVWISEPPFVQKGLAGTPTNTAPVGIYELMVGNPSKGSSVIDHGKNLTTIPSTRVTDASNVPLYAFPGRLQITANRWLIYTMTWAAVGMNQPATNDLHVYDLNTGRDTLIAPFHLFGGTFFSMGTAGRYLAYDQSGMINAKGDLTHNVSLVDLSTGRKIKLPTSALVHNTVQTTISGQRVTIPLQALP